MTENRNNPNTQAAEITKLIMQHRIMMFGYIMTQTGDYNAAEDIFQEVCVTVCEKFDEFEKGTNFKAWAMAITRIKILNYYQSTQEKKGVVRLSEEIADELAQSPVWEEEEKPFKEELVALRDCLENVKGKSRLILLKRYGDGLSCGKIAEFLNWTVNAVYVALSRVRDSLEECIKKRLSLEG
jgi:RNA polymerase sigma-70 factor (ECF subfamily)